MTQNRHCVFERAPCDFYETLIYKKKKAIIKIFLWVWARLTQEGKYMRNIENISTYWEYKPPSSRN